MTSQEIRTLILKHLGEIAPEIDPGQLDPQVELRQQVDLDSMDLLNLMTAISTATGIEIPEADYPQMATLDGAVAYLSAHIKSG
jgi:acyl carrier protein